jgi:CRISPR/Cas system CSM-associated protein Csm2 small subunit
MSKQKPLEVWDNFDNILQAGQIDAIGLHFEDQSEGLNIVAQVLEAMVSILGQFDKQWTELFREDAEQMNLWKYRLRVFYLATQNVRVAMMKAGEPDWDNIALDLGFMNAFRTAAELALGLYQSERKQPDTSGGA